MIFLLPARGSQRQFNRSGKAGAEPRIRHSATCSPVRRGIRSGVKEEVGAGSGECIFDELFGVGRRR